MAEEMLLPSLADFDLLVKKFKIQVQRVVLSPILESLEISLYGVTDMECRE